MKETKIQYIGQLFAIIGLELIMLLFKIVQPIHLGSMITNDAIADLMNHMIYGAISFGLIILVVGHFIFKRPLSEMGLKGFKEHLFSFISNLVFLVICIGITYVISTMSKVVEFNLLSIVAHIISSFIAVALVDEFIFRGLIFNQLKAIFDGHAIIASFVTGGIFAISYVPNVIMALDVVSGQAVLEALYVPFLLGIYLSLLYDYTDNLWVCVAIHGTVLSLSYLSADFFTNIFYGIYIVVIVIYLGYHIFKHYRKDVEEEVLEEQKDLDTVEEVKPFIEEEISVNDLAEEKEEIQANSKEDLKVEIPYFKEETDSEVIDDEIESVIENKEEVTQQLSDDELNGLSEEISETLEEEEVFQRLDVQASNKQDEEEDDIDYKENELENKQQEEQKVIKQEELEETEEKVSEEDVDLEITAIVPMIDEELLEDALENTVVIPELGKKDAVKVIAFNKYTKQVTPIEERTKLVKGVKPEPNYIAHLEKYLGEFEEIYKQMTPTDPPIDILFFKGPKYNALVTNGMRAIPVALPLEMGGYQHLELMMFLDKSIDISQENIEKEENAWLIKLLIDLALFPAETNSYLGIGHIVGNGANLAPYTKKSDYCGALVFTPMEQENVLFYRYVEKGTTVYIHNVMPLFKDELRFIQEHSADQFINLMSELGVKQTIKRERIDVIKTMKKEQEEQD